MTDTPIESGWREIMAANNGFCCEHCREAFRAMYFAGAMGAMGTIAGFNPEAPEIIAVSTRAIVMVSLELAAAYIAAEAEQPNLVRH